MVLRLKIEESWLTVRFHFFEIFFENSAFYLFQKVASNTSVWHSLSSLSCSADTKMLTRSFFAQMWANWDSGSYERFSEMNHSCGLSVN